MPAGMPEFRATDGNSLFMSGLISAISAFVDIDTGLRYWTPGSVIYAGMTCFLAPLKPIANQVGSLGVCVEKRLDG
jgi:hypothetical protein